MSHLPRAAIYARFSTDMQNARSADDQARLCREHAERQGWAVGETFADHAISGTNRHRPGLNQLLAAAAGGRIEIVIAEALDRVARDQADIAQIFKQLEFAGVQLHTLSEGRISELHVGLLGTMNALFVKELGNKIRRGAKGAVARGRIPGGLSYGYEAAPVIRADGSIERGLRRIREDQAAVVRRIFAAFAAGESARAIAIALNRDGIPAPRGPVWRATTLTGTPGRQNGVLRNPAYGGRIVYGRVRMVKDPESRKRLSRANAAEDLETFDAPDLRIVDADTIAAVQARFATFEGVAPLKLRKPRHLLSGLVSCGECGATYTIISKDRWGCSAHRETGLCANPRRIGTKRLEDRVLGGLQERLLAPEVISTVVKRYHDERAATRKARQGTRARAEMRVEQLKEEIARLVDALAAGVGFDEIRLGLADRRERLAQAEAALEEFEAEPAIVLHPNIVEAYKQKIAQLGSAITNGQHASQHLQTIRGLIDTVLVKDDPHQPDCASVELVGSLASVLALASGKPMPARPAKRAGRTVQVVAEEGLEPPTPGL